jgi:hypothetical protein
MPPSPDGFAQRFADQDLVGSGEHEDAAFRLLQRGKQRLHVARAHDADAHR